MAVGVLIVEDNIETRAALVSMLQSLGFTVYGAESVSHARQLFQKLWRELAVVVLDMDLEAFGEGMNGGQLGIQLKQSLPEAGPEFLVASRIAKLEYYRMAIEFGAAAFISHTGLSADRENIVRHVQALALRHGLSTSRRAVLERVARIADTSRDQSEAITRLCAEVVAPVLKETIRTPFMLLCGANDTLSCVNGRGDIVDRGSRFYNFVQRFAFSDLAVAGPLPLTSEGIALFRQLSQLKETDSGFRVAHVVRLAAEAPMALSLVLDQPEGGEESAGALAQVVTRYLPSAVLAALMRLTAMFTERAVARRQMAAATGELCLHVGQEQLAMLREAESDPQLTGNPLIGELKSVAEDLRDAGEALWSVCGSSSDERSVRGTVKGQDLVAAVLDDLEELGALQRSQVLITGDCRMMADSGDLRFAVGRLMNWCANRMPHDGSSLTPPIRINCTELNGEGVLTIEDHSRRLGTTLRARMFSPFGAGEGRARMAAGLHMPMYVARVLVEEGNGGLLEDQSDSVSGDHGHRFVLRVPHEAAVRPTW